jgi:hypothetical protein
MNPVGVVFLGCGLKHLKYNGVSGVKQPAYNFFDIQ